MTGKCPREIKANDRIVYGGYISTSREKTFLKTMDDLLNMKIIDDHILVEIKE